jgi:uncharacterized membrane protein YgcG
MTPGNSTALVTFAIAALVITNLIATRAVLRAGGLSIPQRAMQLAMVWLLPVVGAIVCIAFASSQASAAVANGTIDPLYSPREGQVADGSMTGLCGCNSDGGDGSAGGDGGDGGGGGD